MRTVKELREIQAELMTEAEGLRDHVENGKPLDKAQQSRWDALLDEGAGELTKINDELKAATQAANQRKQAAAIRLGQQLSDSAGAPFPISGTQGPQINSNRGNAMTPPKVLTTSRLQAFTGPNAQAEAYQCGHWLKAVVARMRGFQDEQSEAIAMQSGYNLTATEGTDSAGGYVVPDPLASAIIETRERVGVSRQLSDIYTMTSDTLKIPKQTAGPTVQYPGEATAITASDSTWGQVNLTAVKRAVLSKISNELAADAIISIVDQAASRIGYELAKQEDNEFVNGDGSGTYGGETGLLSSLGAAGIFTAGTGDDLWSELALIDFTDTMAILPSDYADGSESWLCSNAFYYNVMVKLLSAAGGNTLVNLEAGSASRPTFLGKPVFLTDQMPTATAAATVACLYGNFRNAVIIGDRTQLQIAVSEQRYFEEDVLALRAVARYDINVHEPGDGSNAGAYVGLKTAA